MAIHWQIKFMSFLGTSYVLSIYDVDYTGSDVTQLTGAANPFSTNEDNNQDYYTPIRSQSGYIRFIVTNYSVVQAMMPIKATDRPVVLRDISNNVMWAGFLSCEQYSQPWEPSPYEVEIPVVSVMEAMRGVMFTQDEGYVSLRSLVTTIYGYTPLGSVDITVPDDIPATGLLVNNNNFRDFQTVTERVTKDTSDIYSCVSLYDVMTSFCQYFGISLREYKGVMYFAAHDTGYQDVASDGDTQQTQWGSPSMEYMDICGADNNVGYSSPYRLIDGKFNTNRDKASKLFGMGEFLKEFSINQTYPPGVDTFLLFNGNAEILPYCNGVQRVSPLALGYNDTGGQIVRTRSINTLDIARTGNEVTDCFYILSKKSKRGTPETAMRFLIPRKVYINGGESVVLNINANIGYENYEFVGNRLYCKVKVGNYWLKSEVPSESPDYTSYSWVTTETTCWLLIKDGRLTLENTIMTIPYNITNMMDKFSGFAILLPSVLSAGYYDIQIDLMANAQLSDDEFKTEEQTSGYEWIDHMLTSFDVKLLRATTSFNNPTPSFDENSIIRNTSGDFSDNYSVESDITTRQGAQYGTGLALNSDKTYVTTRYDLHGIVRRKNLYNRSREVIEVSVRKNTKPVDYITYSSKTYAILSQSINWRDDKNRIIILDITE